MGIIGKIRKHSWVAVVLVGGAIIAFILGDLTKNTSKIPDLGKVDGATMTSQRFNELVKELEDNYKTQQQTAQVPAEMERQMREQVWQNFVDETLMEEQTQKLGLQVTKAEMSDMYTGAFIHPYLRQMFTNPQTGQYDLRQVNYMIENFDQLDTNFRMQWVELEKYVRRDREQQKYAQLITSGFYMPKAIAAKVSEMGSKMVNARVVALPFQNVADNEVELTDNDFKAYYNNHKAEFRVREEMRDLEFITYPVNPTPEDLAKIEEDVMKTWAEFQTIPNEELAFFVTSESDVAYDSNYKAATEFAAPFGDMVAASADGAMLAPQVVNGNWMMAKVVSSAVRPDSLRATVAIVYGGDFDRAPRTGEVARQRADSALAAFNSGMEPKQVVEAYSDERIGEDGDMGWLPDGTYNLSFGTNIIRINDRIVNTATGSSFIEELPGKMGYIVVKVTDKTKAYKKYRVAVITNEIIPSNNTNRAVYAEANKFAGQNRTLDEMTSAAQQGNMQVRSARVSMMDDNMAGVANARSIVQWAYNKDTKVGAVADQVFECDGMFVVVALKDVYKKGYVELDQARPMIENQVRIEKKAELLMARADEAVKAGKDIESIAVKLGTQVDSLNGVGFNDYYLGRYGMEPKVQTAIATGSKGIVGPVKGASGVYIINIDDINAAEKVADDNAIQRRLEQGYSNKGRALTQVLRDNAKITDQRNKFF